MKIFSIYDSKAEAYIQPFYSLTPAAAIRIFSEAAQDEGDSNGRPAHAFNKHGADYTLFMVGEWDERTGIIKPTDAKTALGCAIDFISGGDNG